MDNEQKANYIVSTANTIIKTFYKVGEKRADAGQLIKQVNVFFDKIKDWKIECGLLDFLYEISVLIGLPHYFDMFLKFSNNVYAPTITVSVLTANIYESSLVIGKDEKDEFQKLHKYQKEVIDKFESNKANRFFLTAPTSFGKTYIVNEIIKKLKYNKIVLIFPTLSLLAENYARLLKDPFFRDYRIHTLSSFESTDSDKSVWIYTPERFMTMTDKNPNLEFDFVFMDEIYKIDNKFIIDNETIGESERDVSFRIALTLTCKRSKDFLLTGPYINIPNNAPAASITNFFNDNEITALDYNKIEIVDKEVISISANQSYEVDGIAFGITNSNKGKRLAKVIGAIGAENGNTIVYVARRFDAEREAKKFANTREEFTEDQVLAIAGINLAEKRRFINFVMHLNSKFARDWVLIKCLKCRIGIHHGYVPKYIQKEVIHFFNIGILDCIFSTTTITEGVNTSAKNMVVLSDKKGDKPLKKFDAQNIAGRAGRFIYHFKGRVVAIDNEFETILSDADSYINHVGYDVTQNKSEVDIMVSKEKYLTASDKRTRKELLEEAQRIGMAQDIIDQFKSLPLRDKILLYKNMQNFSGVDEFALTNLINRLKIMQLEWDGFETVLRYVLPIVKNDSLKGMIERKCKNGIHCVLTPKVNSYIADGGFGGIFRFEIGRGTQTDSAVKTAAELSFNIFRYHLVKYLGLFDLIYRNMKARSTNVSPDEIVGLSALLQLLEYGTKSDHGKLLSDYGVPFNIIKYIDSVSPTAKARNRDSLDSYETETLIKIKELFDIE